MTRRYELLRVVTARTRGPGLFEPALPLGVDKPPAVFDEFAPSVPLGESDGELGLKLVVNRLVVPDNGVDVLVWLATGVCERMDRGGHPAGHRPVARGALLIACGGRDRSPVGRHRAPNIVDGWLTGLDVRTAAPHQVRMLLCTRRTPAGFIPPCLPCRASPSGAGWLHEIKHDGFRLMARAMPPACGC